MDMNLELIKVEYTGERIIIVENIEQSIWTKELKYSN